MGPRGFWGSGEKGSLFSGCWGALVIIFRELGSKLMVLGIKGALQKVKNKFINLTLKERPPLCLIKKYLTSGVGGLLPPQTPLVKCKCSYFHFHTKMRKPWFLYWRKIWSIIFIFNLLSLTLLIFRLIITCFGIFRIHQIAPFLEKKTIRGACPRTPIVRV